MKNKQLLVLFAFFILCIFSLRSQSAYYPPFSGEYWETSTPADNYYCQDKIHELFNFFEEKKITAFILLIDGKIVIEKYFSPSGKDKSHTWNDAAASLISTLMGIAEKKGILSLDDPLYKYLGEDWAKTNEKKLIESVMIKHLLGMASGLAKENQFSPCISRSCLELIHEPGTEWLYHKANIELAVQVLEKASGQSVNRFLFDHLRSTIGLNGSFTEVKGETTYKSNLRNMARFGILLLNQGEWANGEEVLKDAYVKQLFTSSQEINPAFSLFNWINSSEIHRIAGIDQARDGKFNENAPDDLLAAIGEGGQLINVVPSKKMTWVSFGRNGSAGKIDPKLNNQIWDKINQLSCKNPKKALKRLGSDAKDFLRLTSKVPIKRILVSDTQGKIHYAAEINSNELNISLKQFNKGYYYAKIQFVNDVISTQRFSVK